MVNLNENSGNQSSDRREVVTFGETMAVLIASDAKGIEYSPQLTQSFGGAESNVAIALSRLGHRVGWFTKLGNDPFGRMILKRVRGEGVDVSRVSFSDDHPTGLLAREAVLGKTSVYYYRRYSAASTMKPNDLDRQYIQQAKYLHITGITAALSAECRETVWEAIKIAKSCNVKVIFDPNLRLKLWSVEEARNVLLPLAEEADYFLPGLDELKLLYNTDQWDQIVGRLKALKAVSIVKGGDNETYIVEKESVRAVPYFKVDHVVDPVGAGDAFCAGFIAGILRDFDLQEAVRLGNLVGAITIQAEGDWEAIPTWEQVEAILSGKGHVER